jgi:hypothetical protein
MHHIQTKNPTYHQCKLVKQTKHSQLNNQQKQTQKQTQQTPQTKRSGTQKTHNHPKQNK